MDIELGGSITLKGFSDMGGGELVVAKKIIGGYARKMSDATKDYQELILTIKKVHKTKGSEKYELHVKLLVKGKAYTSEVTDRNLFVALDSSLKKVLNEVNS